MLIRVLFVTVVDPSGTSGQNVATKEIAASLGRNSSVELTLICPEPANKMPPELATHIKMAWYLPQKTSRSFYWHIKAQVSIMKIMRLIIKEKRPHLIVARLGPSLVVSPILARWYKIPYVLLVRGLSARNIRKIKSVRGLELVAKVTLWLNVRLASQVYVAYKKVKEEIDRLRLPSQTKATIFTNAVNPSLFQLLSMKEARGKLALELKESDFVVGFVGSMKERHCLPPLLDAVAQIKKENKYIKLLMVGNGPQLDELREIVRYKGLEKTVIFTDFIPHNQVYLYMTACDVLYGVVDPNEVSNPIKCYEYLACERPIITSQRDEFYFVKKHNLGISLESVESAKIADAIRNLLAIDREERLKMGRVGRDYVVKHHIWDQLVELILGDVDL